MQHGGEQAEAGGSVGFMMNILNLRSRIGVSRRVSSFSAGGEQFRTIKYKKLKVLVLYSATYEHIDVSASRQVYK